MLLNAELKINELNCDVDIPPLKSVKKQCAGQGKLHITDILGQM